MLEKGYGASIIGKAHIKLKKPNQDSYLIANEDEYTLAVVCDGLGSKKYSQIGSKKLCKVIFSKKFILKLLKNIIEFFIILALWEAFLYLIFLIISMRPLKL